MAFACRAAGLPPEPPGRDAADAAAEIPAYAPSANPLSTSAFDGVRLQEGGHGHHHHGGHGGHGKPANEPQPAPAPKSEEPHQHHHGSGQAEASDAGAAPREDHR